MIAAQFSSLMETHMCTNSMTPMYTEGRSIPTYGSYDASSVKSVVQSSAAFNVLASNVNSLQKQQTTMQDKHSKELLAMKETMRDVVCEIDPYNRICDAGPENIRS